MMFVEMGKRIKTDQRYMQIHHMECYDGGI